MYIEMGSMIVTRIMNAVRGRLKAHGKPVLVCRASRRLWVLDSTMGRRVWVLEWVSRIALLLSRRALLLSRRALRLDSRD